MRNLQTAFDRQWAKAKPLVKRRAQRVAMVSSLHTADDLFQEAWLATWLNRHKLPNWDIQVLVRKAHSAMVDVIRSEIGRHGGKVLRLPCVNEIEPGTPENILIAKQALRIVEQRRKKNARLVVILDMLSEGHQIRDIAACLGISENYVFVLKSRLLKELL